MTTLREEILGKIKQAYKYRYTDEWLADAILAKIPQQVDVGEISLCPHCHCMTKNVCGKCQKVKTFASYRGERGEEK